MGGHASVMKLTLRGFLSLVGVVTLLMGMATLLVGVVKPIKGVSSFVMGVVTLHVIPEFLEVGVVTKEGVAIFLVGVSTLIGVIRRVGWLHEGVWAEVGVADFGGDICDLFGEW